MGRFFRFSHVWTLPEAAAAAYDVLVDLEQYPRWWPQVPAVGKLSSDRGVVVCRSFLPYSLTLELTATARDPQAGVLAVGIAGDLEGWSRFRLREAPDRTWVTYEQEVVARARPLAAAPRWLVRANHDWMMRGARIGLSAEIGRRASEAPHP